MKGRATVGIRETTTKGLERITKHPSQRTVRIRSPVRAGPGNPDPLIAVLGLTVTRVRAAGTDHTQLTLKRRLDVLDGIAFGRADIAELVAVGDRIDVVARLTSRRFGGYESLQLDVRDAAPAGAHDVTLGIPTAVVA